MDNLYFINFASGLIMEGHTPCKTTVSAVLTDAGSDGDAVGVSCRLPRRWYVAVVNHNTEKVAGRKLSALGYESYVPVQKETRIWRDGRRRTVERVVIPSRVFVRCTETQRLRDVVRQPYVNRFMTDRAIGSGRSSVAVVSDKEIETLRFILYNTDSRVVIDPSPLRVGDKVRVARGCMSGLEGLVCDGPGNATVAIRLDVLGYALLEISRDDLERIPVTVSPTTNKTT